MPRVNGFTLLELLIISALFSVLLIAGIPAMSLWIQYQKSTALQYTLIHSIQFLSRSIGQYAENHHALPRPRQLHSRVGPELTGFCR